MIAFLILHYKTIDETKMCIQSVQRLDGYNPSNVYIMIVDNASNDGTGEKLAGEYKKNENIEVLILRESLGFSGGNNYGYKKLKYREKIDNLKFLIRRRFFIMKKFFFFCDANVIN